VLFNQLSNYCNYSVASIVWTESVGEKPWVYS
jgi:hypothetical protein